MPYSIGNSQLQVVKGDTNQALQAIGQAYGAVNDSYDKLARLPGMAKAMVQDDADARYTAALNKYSNDPNGLAQALANGEIDTSNVRAETLGKTQDTLSKIQNTYGLNYVQGRQENLDNFMDDPNNTKSYMQALLDARNGNAKGVNNYYAGLKDVPAEFYEYLTKLDPVAQQNKLQELDIARQTAANQRAAYGLQYQKYAVNQKAAAAYARFRTIAHNHKFGDPTKPDYNRTFVSDYLNGTLDDGTGHVYAGTAEDVAAMMMDPEYAKLASEAFGFNLAKHSGSGNDLTPVAKQAETDPNLASANAIAGSNNYDK